MFMQKPFPWLLAGWEKYHAYIQNSRVFSWRRQIRCSSGGVSMLPWEWSYPDVYFWYHSLPADICGLYSLSRQTLLNSDLQNQAEGERVTWSELCFLSGDWSFAKSTMWQSRDVKRHNSNWEKLWNWAVSRHLWKCHEKLKKHSAIFSFGGIS